MKTRAALLVGGGLLGGLVACASDSNEGTANDRDADVILPANDASTAGDADATSVDSGCEGCVPVDCTTTDFCSVTLPTSPTVAFNAVWGSSSSDVWLVGSQGTVLHGDGASFTAVDWQGGAGARDTIFFSVWGASKNDVWFGATGAPIHRSLDRNGEPVWDSVTGAIFDEGSASQGRIAAIWGASKDLWLAGNPSPRFDGYGSFWHEGADADANPVWSAIQAYEGEDMVSPYIRALWGASASDVWAVGDGGKVFHYAPPTDDTPASWTGVNSFTTTPLDAVWGSSASDIWAVGDQGTILHFDGKAWSLATTGLATGQTPDLFAVWVSGPDDVWIAGDGVVLHRTGSNRRQP